MVLYLVPGPAVGGVNTLTLSAIPTPSGTEISIPILPVVPNYTILTLNYTIETSEVSTVGVVLNSPTQTLRLFSDKANGQKIYGWHTNEIVFASNYPVGSGTATFIILALD